MTEFCVVVVGVGAVGKTALTIRFTSNQFIEAYDPTIEDSYRKQIQLDDEIFMVHVMDTAGQDDYSCLRDQYYVSGQGFICVYSITSRISFEQVSNFFKEILRAKERDKVPLVLVGNKKDMEESRQVNPNEGKELAEKFGAPFFEASAKTRENVEETFHECIREILRQDPKLAKKAGGGKKKPKKGGCTLL
eukprot:TRINITY_DN2954_c0_g1_i2.p1 TRINITY_DN2954_c0_g1~~TRINITY_DN2954_c0_g1_i2.p1  ORF type:complete len:191 (+),score=44.72 TRINITY_DN2954_c0_g1_i2:251-823(+)